MRFFHNRSSFCAGGACKPVISHWCLASEHSDKSVLCSIFPVQTFAGQQFYETVTLLERDFYGQYFSIKVRYKCSKLVVDEMHVRNGNSANRQFHLKPFCNDLFKELILICRYLGDNGKDFRH